MLHVYYGEGKGKTTAAAGLAIRALGHGQKVFFLQFLKGGTSGELAVLRQAGASVFSGKAGTKFVSQMTEAEKQETARIHNCFLESAKNADWDLLVLDEACAAVSAGMIDEEKSPAVDAGSSGLSYGNEVRAAPVRAWHYGKGGCGILMDELGVSA